MDIQLNQYQLKSTVFEISVPEGTNRKGTKLKLALILARSENRSHLKTFLRYDAVWHQWPNKNWRNNMRSDCS